MDQAYSVDTKVAAPVPRHYDSASMTLHWLSLVLLVILFASIWTREHASDGDTAALLLTVHRTAGTLLWVATLARLIWKLIVADTPPLPLRMPRIQKLAARANEYALYLLLIAQPVTGFVQSIARGKPFPLLGFQVPVLMVRDRGVTHLFHAIHQTSATVLLVLVGLHACAALFHGIVLRDGVLRSMVPVLRRMARK